MTFITTDASCLATEKERNTDGKSRSVLTYVFHVYDLPGELEREKRDEMRPLLVPHVIVAVWIRGINETWPVIETSDLTDIFQV